MNSSPFIAFTIRTGITLFPLIHKLTSLIGYNQGAAIMSYSFAMKGEQLTMLVLGYNVHCT